jgi:hypothetical protein
MCSPDNWSEGWCDESSNCIASDAPYLAAVFVAKSTHRPRSLPAGYCVLVKYFSLSVSGTSPDKVDLSFKQAANGFGAKCC